MINKIFEELFKPNTDDEVFDRRPDLNFRVGDKVKKKIGDLPHGAYFGTVIKCDWLMDGWACAVDVNAGGKNTVTWVDADMLVPAKQSSVDENLFKPNSPEEVERRRPTPRFEAGDVVLYWAAGHKKLSGKRVKISDRDFDAIEDYWSYHLIEDTEDPYPHAYGWYKEWVLEKI